MSAALLTTLLFSLTAICATQASVRVGPVRANLGRLIVAVVILGAWAHLFGQGLQGNQVHLLFTAGIVGFGAGGWCMLQAFPRIGSTLSLLVMECVAALLTTLAGAWMFDAHLTVWTWGYVLLVLAGVLTGLIPYRLPDVSRKTLIAGATFASIAALGQSLSWILTKGAFINASTIGFILNPMTAAYQRLLGGVVLAVMVFLLHKLHGRPDFRSPLAGSMPPTLAPVPAWAWIGGNAILGPVLGISCMLWAIREVENPGLVQTVVATATLFTVPMARKMENRTFKLNYYIGAAMALAGVAGLVTGA